MALLERFRGRQTRSAGNPLHNLAHQLNGGPLFAGAPVSESTVIGLPAAGAALDRIANGVASAPMEAMRAGVKLTPTPSLLAQPNMLQTPFEFKYELVSSLVVHGNAYLLLGDFDPLNYPRQMTLAHPSDMSVRLSREGLSYSIHGNELDPSTVKHIKGKSMPGCVMGMGVVDQYRQSLSHSLSLSEFSQRHFSEAAVPPLALVAPDGIDEDGWTDLQQMQDEWVSKHARSRRPALLPAGIEIKQLGFTPEQSQFLESRKFSLAETALMFTMPHYMLGAESGSSMTYSNTAQASLDFVKYTLRPWLKRIEQALSSLLPRGTEVSFNMDSELRADAMTRMQVYEVALRNNIYTLDEVRAMESLAPLPPSQVA